jgi:RNA polymerase sigma factor (sigma-70 family)
LEASQKTGPGIDVPAQAGGTHDPAGGEPILGCAERDQVDARNGFRIERGLLRPGAFHLLERNPHLLRFSALACERRAGVVVEVGDLGTAHLHAQKTLGDFHAKANALDAELVAACLVGEREAFGRIVERYQRRLCSLAYSATGSLSESEDLAQEAFVDAWRQLRTLREPEKLRPWLCGILRYKVGRLRRSDGREPVRQAEELELAEEMPSSEEPIADLAMDKEEQAILWSALERVPELYREPLVLYHREHRSEEHVAVALDLTGDAVKQRLARGRKTLQERVLSFVEGALSRSTPGRVFTLGLAALPAIATPAKAAGIGAAEVHGSVMAKSTGLAALLASISGLVSAVLTLRANLDQARTPRERHGVVKVTLLLFSS